MLTIFGIVFLMFCFNLLFGWITMNPVRKLRSGVLRVASYCIVAFVLVVGDYVLVSFLVNALR